MGIGGANWWKCSQFPAVSITFTFFCWPARNNWPNAAGKKTEIWRRCWFFAIYFDNLDIDITYWHWQAVRGQDYSLTNVLLVHHQIEIWFSSVKMVSWQWLYRDIGCMRNCCWASQPGGRCSGLLLMSCLHLDTVVHIYRVFFFTGPPPKQLKYGKPRLGEVRCI